MDKWTGRALASRCVFLCALLFAACGQALADLDPNEPAELIVLAQDAQKKPIEGVNVEFMLGSRADANSLYAKAVTDANGIAVLRMACPQADRVNLIWSIILRCTKPALWDTSGQAYLFSGGRVPVTVTPLQAVTTRLRVLDPQGRPVAHLPLSAGELAWLSPHQTTDDQGVYVCKCPRSQEPQKVRIGGISFPMTYEAEQTLRLSESQIAQLPPHSRLQGRLLDANGAPARGAAVAQAVLSGMFGGGFCVACYSADRVSYVDNDGRFTLDLGDRDILAVFSPEGIPFLYHLNLACWPDVRRTTLHLPPVEGVHKGQLVWPDGTPAAGVILTGKFGSGNLEMSRSDPNDVPCVRTDAQGQFEVPLYFAGSRRFEARNADVYPGDILEQEKVVVKRPDQRSHFGRDLRGDSLPTHRYFLRIRDSNGQEIQTLWATGGHGGFGHQASQPSRDMHTTFLPDARGLAMLTDRPPGKLPISILAPDYRPVNETVDVLVAEDSTIDITLPDAQRSHAVRGKILDPNGQLVKDAYVESYQVEPPDKNVPVGVIRGRAFGEYAQLDPDGSFRLHELEEGMVDVFCSDSPLPGWTDAVPYDANTKDLVIQLHRGGTVKVLLPVGAKFASGITLEYAGEIHQDTSWLRPDSRPEGNAIIFSHVRPGSWNVNLLESSLVISFADTSERTTLGRVEVKEGEETVLDLRAKPDIMPMRQVVKFTAGGKPISGAAVRLYATWATDDANLAADLKDLANDNVKVREGADAALRRAGKAGVGAILANKIAGPEAKLRAEAILASQRPKDGRLESVKPMQADITDDDGTATFSLHGGRRYIAVARLPGKWIGLTAFTTANKPAAPIEIVASRARTLQLTAPDPNSLDCRYFESSILCDSLAPDEAMALFQALGSWAEPGLDPAGHSLEDLPVNRSYELSWKNTSSNRTGSKRIALAADGDTILPVPLDLPPPSTGPMVPTTRSAP